MITNHDYSDYAQLIADWRENPDSFWLDQANQLDWYTPPTRGHSLNAEGMSEWFADGELNTSYLALDHHIDQGRADQAALIYDSPVTGQQSTFTYQQLLDETVNVAATLKKLGVEKGDRVVIYMPMIPETVFAMLACARLGAIHSVVFGGFAAPELASRIDDAQPKVILSASCGIEVNRIIEYKPLLDAALELAEHQPEFCLIKQRSQHPAELNQQRDLDWDDNLQQVDALTPVPLKGNDPLYILYTSGTTGKPKGVVRSNGGHAVALNYSMGAVYAMDAGDVFWSASDVGWVVGHSYIVYGPLIRGCTAILYEGKPVMTPDAGAFWRIIEEHSVKALFTAPTAFRAIRREDPEGSFIKQRNLSCLQQVFAAGERLDPPTQEWLTQQLNVDVIDNWWQTETGWPIAANPTGIEKLRIKPGSATVPQPGYDIVILDDEGHPVDAGVHGNVAIKLPLPPGCLSTLWQDNERFVSAYLSDFPGYYCSGDGGYLDEEGYLFVMGRVDDVINVAGHRLSTGDMEEVLAKHPQVAECAVVAQNCDLKGEVPIGFIVTSSSSNDNEQLAEELRALVRAEIGPLACYQTSHTLAKLPKTRSGKILRKSIKNILNGEPCVTPPTIEDPAALDLVKQALAE